MPRCQHCGLLIGETAAFCPTCGAVGAQRDDPQRIGPPSRRARHTRRWLLGGAVVALLSVAGLVTHVSFSSGRTALRPAAPQVCRLTDSAHLRAGMTAARVAAVLGTTGSVYSPAGLPASAPQFYVYLQDQDGQSLQLLFQSGVFSQGVKGGLH